MWRRQGSHAHHDWRMCARAEGAHHKLAKHASSSVAGYTRSQSYNVMRACTAAHPKYTCMHAYSRSPQGPNSHTVTPRKQTQGSLCSTLNMDRQRTYLNASRVRRRYGRKHGGCRGPGMMAKISVNSKRFFVSSGMSLERMPSTPTE
jgi:hypothetical protein